MKQFQKLVLVGLLISIVACNKEHTPTMEPAQQQPFSKISENLYYSETPIDAIDISNASSIETGTQSRGEGYYFTTGEGGEIVTPDLGPEGPNTYPNYTGACKFIFRLFDSQNCGSCAFPYATVRFRDGIGGAILASYNVSLGQGWIELNVPQSCAVSIEINCGGLTGEPEDRGGSSCLYKIQSAEYGWNQGGYFGWVPTGLEVYYLFRRFQPKGAFGSAYSQYLCDSWCTWNGRLAVGSANPSPATYSFGCGYQTYGVAGSFIKYYQLTQDANTTQNRAVYPLAEGSTYQFNTTPFSPTTTANTNLVCTVSGGAQGNPPMPTSVTFGWGTDARVGCVDGCGIFYVE